MNVGVTDPINGGPVVCLTGAGFTANGTVTIQYGGVPQLYNMGNPTNEIVRNNVPVGPDGKISFLDNEQIPNAVALAIGVPACTAQLEATGTVAIQAIDNATGVSVTTEVPANLWCEVGPASFGMTCPSISVLYHQVGACDGSSSSSGVFSVGPNAAYVVFGFEDVVSNDPAPFVLSPTGIVIQHDPILNPLVINDPIDQFIFGAARTLTATAVPPGQLVAFQPVVFGAGIVQTITTDGAVQANEQPYDLNYDAAPDDPAINFVKSNASVFDFPQTDDCSSIALQ